MSHRPAKSIRHRPSAEPARKSLAVGIERTEGAISNSAIPNLRVDRLGKLLKQFASDILFPAILSGLLIWPSGPVADVGQRPAGLHMFAAGSVPLCRLLENLPKIARQVLPPLGELAG